jgi:hypothetical protein
VATRVGTATGIGRRIRRMAAEVGAVATESRSAVT